MTVGDTQPTEPFPEWQEAPRRRRAVWPWIVVVIVVAGLAVAAWFAAEWIARTLVENTIRDQVTSNLALPADHPVDVAVEGAVIPQLISGTLQQVTVSSHDVPLGPTVGDVSVQADDIAIRGDTVADAASATIRFDEDQTRALMSTVDGFPADSLGLASPNITVSTELSFLGLSFPIGVALTPSASDGDLVLSPAQLTLGGADISADDLHDRFGGVADAVLQDYTLCVAQYLPAGIVLDDVAVTNDQLVARFAVDGRIAVDPALQSKGTCA